LMLTLALDFGYYVIRPDLVNEMVPASTQTTSVAPLHVVRECWLSRPAELTVDLVKCEEMLKIMRQVPYLRNVMRMMDEVGYTLTNDKLPLGCVANWREQIIRYNVTPQSAMLDPGQNLMANQVITGVIPQFSVTNSMRGIEKNMGWFYKEQLQKHLLHQKKKAVEDSMVDQALEDSFDILLDASSFDIGKKKVYRDCWNEVPELKHQKTQLMYAQDGETVTTVTDALEVLVQQGIPTTFGVKTEEYMIIRETVMLIHGTNSVVANAVGGEWKHTTDFTEQLREVTRMGTGAVHRFVPTNDNTDENVFEATQVDVEHAEATGKLCESVHAIDGIPGGRTEKRPRTEGNTDLTQWVAYAIKVALVVYEEQLLVSTTIPGERIGGENKSVIEQTEEERWNLFMELCDLAASSPG
jgi:hypothetical protein